jgi:hypothetical protein
MIEIASAAYWAADARNGDKRLAKSTEPSVNPLRAAIESIYSQLIAKASPAPIAAEAASAGGDRIRLPERRSPDGLSTKGQTQFDNGWNSALCEVEMLNAGRI